MRGIGHNLLEADKDDDFNEDKTFRGKNLPGNNQLS